MSTNAHQPAFPTEVRHEDGKMLPANQTGNDTAIYRGLTKREYFAAMAMQGLAATLAGDINRYTVNGGFLHFESISKDAISLADALLAELDKD